MKNTYKIAYTAKGKTTMQTTDNFDMALNIYNSAKKFIENSGFVGVLSMWDAYRCVKTETINGNEVTFEDVFKR